MAGDINKLKKLRMGIPPHTIVPLGNGDEEVSVAVVLLRSDKLFEIEEETEAYCQANKGRINLNVRSQFYNRLLAFNCTRDPSDLNERVVESPDELAQLLDLEDIQRIVKAYNELVTNKAPKIEAISNEEFEQLKKLFEVVSLNDLSTVSLIHLRYFLQTLAS